MRVTYIDHSGFLVETESAVFLFDYYKGKLPAFPAHKPLFIFASHKHPDHFSFKIFDLYGHPGGVAYIFGNDIKLSERYLQRHNIDPAVKEKIHRMFPHTELVLPLQGDKGNRGEAVLIHALKSTDAGAAFYVREGNIRIYHGGDLNWWHWDEESEEFKRWQEQTYKQQIMLLKGRKIDLSFVTVDPRLGKNQFLGIDFFMQQVKTGYVLPMHLWKQYELIEEYRQKQENSRWRERILKVERENQEIVL